MRPGAENVSAAIMGTPPSLSADIVPRHRPTGKHKSAVVPLRQLREAAQPFRRQTASY
jgi:hypothetical protein